MSERKPFMAKAHGLTPNTAPTPPSDTISLPGPPKRTTTREGDTPTKATPTPRTPRGRRQAAVSLTLPAPLVERVRKQALTTGMAQAQVVTSALAQVHADLPNLVHHKRQAHKAALFSNLAKTNTEHTAPLVIRLTPEDIAVLDTLVATSGAASRSEACEIALTTALAND